MKYFAAALLLIIMCAGCQPGFNKAKWRATDGLIFPHRDAMVDQLVNDKMLIGLTYPQLEEMLGRPDAQDSTGVWYAIKSVRDSSDELTYYRNLICRFNKKLVVSQTELEEWKAGGKVTYKVVK